VLSASATGTIRDLSASVGVNIGADTYDNNYFFDGTLDDIRIYEGALSLSDTQEIYDYGASQQMAIEYHGIRSTDPNGGNGLRNPERGFRLEMVGGEIQLGAPHYPGGQVICLPLAVQQELTGTESNDDLWVKCFDYYSDQGLTLALMYVYLIDYWNTEIPQSKLTALQTTFDYFRNNGYKVIPLFVYERVSYDPWGGPTVATILNHLNQLEPVIERNTDIIAYMRAGFVGTYGEWHHSYQRLERDHDGLSQIMNKLLHIVPEDRMICVRVPKYKRWVLRQTYPYQYELLGDQEAYSRSTKARIGHADDGFMASYGGIMTDGEAWPEPPYYASTGNPEFDMMTAESPYVAVDGEMFIQNAGGIIDGYEAAKRLRLHHYNSLSFFHGNNEMELYGDPTPPEYNINIWQETNISRSQLVTDKMPISDGYFEDSNGNAVNRTQFEYIRDHFGYRFELQRAMFTDKVVQGEEFTVDIELINRGFAAAINPRPVYIVLIDQAGQVLEYKTCADPRNWQPFKPDDQEYTPLVHTFGTNIKLPENISCGTFKLGLWMPDAYETLRLNSNYSIRVANRDVEWWSGSNNNYGINILGEIEVFCKPELQWGMNEGTGATVEDSSGNNRDGTIHNAARVAGLEGGAIEFTGSGQYIDISSSDISVPWTVSLWVKRQSSPNSLSTLLNSSNSSLRLEQFNNTKKVGFTKPGVADYAFNYEAPIGQWRHLVFVGTQTGTSLWVNGSFVETISASISCPMSTVSVSWAGGELYGAIDDLRIYSDALDQDYISYLYSTMPPDYASSPIPFTGATNVSIDADLSWIASPGATSHKVYFGTDPTPDETEYCGCQTGTVYDPGVLSPNTTYYWQIDEVGYGGTTTGDVWSFTATNRYTEKFNDMTIGTASAWTDVDLSGYGVGANQVVEIGIRNSSTSTARDAGVRIKGSSLARKIVLHAATTAGWDMTTMTVKTDANKKIQAYAASTSDIHFYLVGIWNSGDYTEKYQALTIGTTGSWVDSPDLSTYGVAANNVVEVMASKKSTTAYIAGIRGNGSALDRKLILHASTSSAADCLVMQAKADANKKIEVWKGNNSVTFTLLGYWTTAPGTYTEKFVDVGKPSSSATWTSRSLSGQSVPAYAICEMLIANASTTNHNNVGVRRADSSLSRLFDIHKSSASTARECSMMHVEADANSNIYQYLQNSGDTVNYYLLGYWN
jgi:hypothetical protein